MWRHIFSRARVWERKYKDSEAYFLDLSILIENKKNKAKLFDKRDAFPFYIV